MTGFLQRFLEKRLEDSRASNKRNSKRGGSLYRRNRYGSSINQYSRDTGMSAAEITQARQQKEMADAIKESSAKQTEYERLTLMQQQEYIAQNRKIAASQQKANAEVQSQMNNQMLMSQMVQPGGPMPHGKGEEDGEKKGSSDKSKARNSIKKDIDDVSDSKNMEKDVGTASKNAPKYTAESVEQGLKDGSLRQLTEDEINSGKYDKALKRGKYAPKKSYNKRFSDFFKGKDEDPKDDANTAKNTIQNDVNKTAGDVKTSDTSPTTTSPTQEIDDSKKNAQNNINSSIDKTTDNTENMSFDEFKKEENAGTLTDSQEFEQATGQPLTLDTPTQSTLEDASQGINSTVQTTDEAINAGKDAAYLEDAGKDATSFEEVGEDVMKML